MAEAIGITHSKKFIIYNPGNNTLVLWSIGDNMITSSIHVKLFPQYNIHISMNDMFICIYDDSIILWFELRRKSLVLHENETGEKLENIYYKFRREFNKKLKNKKNF